MRKVKGGYLFTKKEIKEKYGGIKWANPKFLKKWRGYVIYILRDGEMAYLATSRLLGITIGDLITMIEEDPDHTLYYFKKPSLLARLRKGLGL